MGDIQFNGTPEEWDALVKKNKKKEEPKPTIKQVDYVAKKQERMYSETFEFAEWCDNMGYTQVDNSFWKSLSDEKGKTTTELFEQFKKK